MLNFCMLKTVLKLSIATALCFWLFKNGKLDFTLITQAFSLGYWWILGVILIGAHLLITSCRFKTFLNANLSIPLPFLKVISFDAIGNMFAFILPGTAAGDLTRLYYYAKSNHELTAGTLASYLLVDRFMGVLSLLGIASTAGILQFTELTGMDSRFKYIILFYILCASVVLLFFILLITTNVATSPLLRFIINLFKRFPKIQKVLVDMLSVKLSLNTFIKCMLISLFNHACVILGFWSLIFPFIPNTVSFMKVFSIIPLGFMGSAIPIAPSGLGVGHVLFDNLFKLLGIYNGASIYNLYYLMTLFVALFGIIPYLFIRKSSDPKII